VQIVPFLAVAAVVVITPGVDTALVTRNALMHGRTSALASAIGVNVGIAFWTIAAAAGLAALVAASAQAFLAIKLAGAVYLVYLGLHALRSSRRPAAGVSERATRTALSVAASFRQGLVSNLLNPKIAVFFTSLLPQFVGTHGAVAPRLILLGALFNVMGITWLATYAVLASRGRDLLSRPRVRKAMDRLTGVVLVGLGVRLALERRA
jgi:RhtB (resistance to homoserine/threonine) family protein